MGRGRPSDRSACTTCAHAHSSSPESHFGMVYNQQTCPDQALHLDDPNLGRETLTNSGVQPKALKISGAQQQRKAFEKDTALWML